MATHNIATLPKQFSPHPTNPRFHDLTGNRYGRLTVKGYSHHQDNSFWFVECDCGVVKIVNSRTLIRGNTKSCGCWNRDQLAISKRTHGQSINRKPTKAFYAYYHAKARCTNPKYPLYHRYGGRGIEFRFTSVQEFLNALPPHPGKGFSLNRINNDGHYESGNVEWATATTQANNRRTSHYLTVNGRKLTLSEWSKEVGIKPPTLKRRIQSGWCSQCVIHNKLKQRCPHILKTD